VPRADYQDGRPAVGPQSFNETHVSSGIAG
jgi:hypothetical protein